MKWRCFTTGHDSHATLQISVYGNPRIQSHILTLGDATDTVSRNVRNVMSVDAVSHSRRSKASTS